MTYRGHVVNGAVVLDENAELPEGAEVKVELVQADPHPVADQVEDTSKQEKTIWEKLLEIAGTVEGPEDWAENHDHYIHGTPKRRQE